LLSNTYIGWLHRQYHLGHILGSAAVRPRARLAPCQPRPPCARKTCPERMLSKGRAKCLAPAARVGYADSVMRGAAGHPGLFPGRPPVTAVRTGPARRRPGRQEWHPDPGETRAKRNPGSCTAARAGEGGPRLTLNCTIRETLRSKAPKKETPAPAPPRGRGKKARG